MKVVQINTVAGSGSVGRITAGLCGKSLETGIQAVVCYGRRKAQDGMPAYKIGNPLDFMSHVLRNFFRGESGFGSKKVTRKLLVFLEEIKPDVIHLHNIHGFYLNIELLFQYIKDKKIPVVWTFHDCWPMTGHCAYFDYAGCKKWKTGCFQCPQYRSAYPYALFKDNSASNYDRKRALFTGISDLTIVTPSKWLQTIVKQSFLREYPSEVIYNGIDLTVFEPQQEEGQTGFPPERTEYMILGAANIWEKRKGLSYFEELAKKLPKAYKIVLIGVSKKQAEKLRQKEKAGVLPRGKIKVVNRTDSQKELAEWYRKADIYVNTTMEDNFPTTNLEALACGTPVITFSTGGSPEAVDEKSGIVVEKGNVEALVLAILKMAEQPLENKISIQKECRKRALLFDKEERFQEYMELYQKIYRKIGIKNTDGC